MKTLLLKTLLFLSPFALFAFIFTPSVIDEAMRHTNSSDNYQEWNDLFDSRIQADLLIQGSSTAWVHVNPAVLDTALDLNTYNLGLDGYRFRMQYYRFLAYRHHNKKPKYILQIRDYITLGNQEDLYMLEQFIPYVHHPEIREAVKNYNGLEKKDFSLPFYKYLHCRDFFADALLQIMGTPFPGNGKYKGFKSNGRQWDAAFRNFKQLHPDGYDSPLDTLALGLFEQFLQDCRRDTIQVILVTPPAYYEATQFMRNRKQIDSIYLSLSTRYQLQYLDYTQDSICLDTTNFYNSQHLNTIGVEKFNRILSRDLRAIIH